MPDYPFPGAPNSNAQKIPAGQVGFRIASAEQASAIPFCRRASRRRMAEGRKILILDVRPLDARTAGGINPGAVAAHATEIRAVLETHPHEQETIVYCACPNEASAATAAKHLRRAGFKRIRPLLGGIDAWVQAGHLLEQYQGHAMATR